MIFSQMTSSDFFEEHISVFMKYSSYQHFVDVYLPQKSIGDTLKAKGLSGLVLKAQFYFLSKISGENFSKDRIGDFKQPRIESLARRWSDRILEIREAAQTILLDQMRRLGDEGRAKLMDEWASSLQTESYEMGGSDQKENTAIVILGVLGAEFNCLGDLTNTVAKKLLDLLKANDNSIVKRTSVELIGRGFW